MLLEQLLAGWGVYNVVINKRDWQLCDVDLALSVLGIWLLLVII